MKKREQYIDILRALACILVVLTHCVPPSSEAGPSSIHAFISFICAPSSELFLAISGALLLPVMMPTGPFLRKRFTRVFPPLLIWSVIIISYRLLTGAATTGESLRSMLMIPIRPVLGPYWFFYVISGLYIFAPVISKWLSGAAKKEIGFFLILWSITLALGSVSILTGSDLVRIEGNYYFILSSFGGFLGYMVLGSYLRNHTPVRSVKRNFAVPAAIILSLLALAVTGYKLRMVSADFFLENLSLPTALMVYSIFMLVKDLSIRNRAVTRLVSELASCSFGIYLTHIFIARGPVWHFIRNSVLAESHLLVQIVFSLFATLAISYLIVRLIKLLPFGKYIVG